MKSSWRGDLKSSPGTTLNPGQVAHPWKRCCSKSESAKIQQSFLVPQVSSLYFDLPWSRRMERHELGISKFWTKRSQRLTIDATLPMQISRGVAAWWEKYIADIVQLCSQSSDRHGKRREIWSRRTCPSTSEPFGRFIGLLFTSTLTDIQNQLSCSFSTSDDLFQSRAIYQGTWPPQLNQLLFTLRLACSSIHAHEVIECTSCSPSLGDRS